MTAPGAGTPAAPASGRAAYEAYQRAFPGQNWGPWDTLSDEEREGWTVIAHDAAAAARVPSLVINFDEEVTEERAAQIRQSLSDALAEPTIAGRAKIRDLTDERDSLTGRAAELADFADELRGRFATLLTDRNHLHVALQRIALGQDRDPSVAADRALVASNELRELWEAAGDSRDGSE